MTELIDKGMVEFVQKICITGVRNTDDLAAIGVFLDLLEVDENRDDLKGLAAKARTAARRHIFKAHRSGEEGAIQVTIQNAWSLQDIDDSITNFMERVSLALAS